MKKQIYHSNPFAKLGMQFIDRIDTILCELEENKQREDHEVIAEVMPDVIIMPGSILHLHRAVHEGHGDTSYFFTRNMIDGTEKRDIASDILIASDNRVNQIWQAYLLTHADTLLPAYWHGGYKRRTFIFNEDDMACIGYFKNRDWRVIAPIEYLMPQVTTVDENTCKVVCHFWNEWRGLVRETTTYTLNGASIAAVEQKQEVIFPYHCGIWY